MGRAQDLRIVDPVLTELARGYTNAELVANSIFPRVEVEKEAGKIPQFGKEAFKEYDTLRALRGNTNLMPVDARTTIDMVMDEHDLGYPIDVREKAESTFDEQKIGTDLVTSGIALKREILAATAAFTAGNYASENKLTLTSTAQFTHLSSTPIATIETGKEAVRTAIGRYPNTMLMGASVYNTLKNHATLLARIQYSMLGVVTIDLMKQIFGIENIFVGKAVKASDAGVFSDVWNDSLLLAYVAIGSQSEHVPSYGYTIGKKGYPQIDRYLLNGGKVEVVRNTDIFKVQIVGATAGYLLSDCNA
jgi:hypothetical protein